MSKETFNVNNFIFDAQQPSDFEQLVLKNSVLGPVLVNFWSRKTDPDFQQYPILEKLIESYSGTFLLVNIETDENKKISHDYAVNGVPTLKLFSRGKVVKTLSDIPNEQNLRIMLDQFIASENDFIIVQAQQLFEQGETEKAYLQLEQASLTYPHYDKLPLTIASLMRTEGRFRDAFKLLKSLPDAVRKESACKKLLIECDFGDMASPVQDANDLIPFVRTNMNELPAVKLLAAWYVTQKDYKSALELFHIIMQKSRSFEDDLGRRSIVKILALLEKNHPFIKRYRDVIRKLNN